MATRHLKRLQQARELAEATPAAVAASKEDNEEDDDGGGSKPFNPFDLLSDNEDAAAMQDDDDASDGADAKAPQSRPALYLPSDKTTTATAASSKNKARKKKATREGKSRVTGVAEASDTAAAETDSTKAGAAGDVDEIDRLIQEMNLKTVGAAGLEQEQQKQATHSEGPLLGVDVRSLRGDDELRRIFGADVVQSVDREDGGGDHDGGAALHGGRRRLGTQPRGVATARRRLLKRGALVTPREHWPPFEGGLGMVYESVMDNKQVFRYTYSASYSHVQHMFEECQASYDPNSIAALLRQAPYHVDSLLAMYDLYRHMGEHSSAEECLNRALYALEAAWLPSFNIASANCRLRFEVDENRPLFIALFRRAQALSRQGCHRTALEVCKLLLALDPDDPMGALCMVDYLALRAGRYAFLRRFVSEWDSSKSLALLPSYAYATALAAFRQEQDRELAASAAEARRRGSGVASTSGAMQQHTVTGAANSGPTADELMVQALLLHPLVLPQLVAKLQDKGSARDSIWTVLLGRRPFRDADEGGSASLSHLVSIYAERSHLLWKAPDALHFLRRGASTAADVAEGHGPQQEGLVMDANDWAAVQHEAFPSSNKNEYRHLRLHDFSDNVNALPREEVNAAMAQGGLQQVEEQLEDLQRQLFDAANQQVAAAGGPAAVAAMTDEELQSAHPLMMLLRSMLPWVDAGQQPEYGADSATAAPGQHQPGPAPGPAP